MMWREAVHEGLGWLSIVDGCENYGNCIIEETLRGIIGGPTDHAISAFRPLSQGDATALSLRRAVVLPGATLLDSREYPALLSLRSVQSRIFGLGVAFCAEDHEKLDLDIALQLSQPIGSRDPFTHESLTANGIRSELIGCASLFVGDAVRWTHQPGNIVFSFGRGPQLPLVQCLLSCAELGKTTVLDHVPRLQPKLALAPGIERMPLTGRDHAIRTYRAASVVVTSRIHALLPCIALGTPCLFLGGWRDSRYSLLDLLGVPVHEPVPDRVRAIVSSILSGLTPSDRPLAQAAQLRANFGQYLGEYIDR
jgi:hypothetical protein